MLSELLARANVVDLVALAALLVLVVLPNAYRFVWALLKTLVSAAIVVVSVYVLAELWVKNSSQNAQDTSFDTIRDSTSYKVGETITTTIQRTGVMTQWIFSFIDLLKSNK
jgi:hypothetical protein